MKRSRDGLRGLACLCLGLVCWLTLGAQSAFSASSPKPLEEALASDMLTTRLQLNAAERQALREIYHGVDFNRLWLQEAAPTRQAAELQAVLRAADQYGLQPTAYLPTNLDPKRDATRFDLELSLAAVRFVTAVHAGRVSPRDAKFDLREPRPRLDLATVVPTLARARNVVHEIAKHEPQSPYYDLLKQQLAVYRRLASDPTLTLLPAFPGRSLMPGAPYSGTYELRRLLHALGDLPADRAGAPAGAADGTLDATLVAALQAFQKRHGLEADGVLGPRTYAALTIPLTQRVRQIELALERWRWLPPLPAPLIVVNVPHFMLYGFPPSGRSDAVLEVPVIVGRDYPRMQTPIFSGALEYVVFRPYWDVPYSIMKNELLPEIRRSPKYLERHHMEIVRGQSDNARAVTATPENLDALLARTLRLRQRPGPDNALGLIKFMLPNAYNVYLHGTPAVELFQRSRRAFSHGCIRVSDPVALAQYVLQNVPEKWDAAKIEAAMGGTKTSRVYLRKPLPVMILYATAVATMTHGMLFFDDVYGLDKELERLLELAPVTAGDLADASS